MNKRRNSRKERKYTSLRNAAIVFGFIITPIGLFAMSFFGSRDERLTAVSLLFSLLALVIGVILFFVYIGKIKKTSQGSKLALLALGLEFVTPLLLLLLAVVNVVVAILCLLPAICMPIIGVVVGIQALFEAKKKGDRLVVFLSLLAIVLPIAVVAFSVLMFSTGVWVIRFM